MRLTLEVNGERHELEVADDRRLLDVVREDLRPDGHEGGLRRGRLRGLRGAARRPPGQRVPRARSRGRGPAGDDDRGPLRGRWDGAAAAFVEEDALQCGFCTPGQIVSATALLAAGRPTVEEVRAAMTGNLCRCGAYARIERAVLRVAGGAPMPRLVKTQTQFEGRFEETWTLVEETDELPPWEEDAELTVVGWPRPRQDGGLRAAGAARFTVDVELPGMLRTAVLRSPHAHARLVGSTSRRLGRCPACARRSGRGTSSSPAGARC